MKENTDKCHFRNSNKRIYREKSWLGKALKLIQNFIFDVHF